MNALSTFLSKDNEPVRIYLYGVAAAVLVLLGTLGVLTGSVITAISGLLVAALLVPTAAVLRNKVSPVPLRVPVPVPAEDEVPVPDEESMH